MTPVGKKGPNVKQMASQYAAVKEEKPKENTNSNSNSATSVVKPGTVANLKKQYAATESQAVFMYKSKGEIPTGLEGKQEETKPKPAVDASYMYKDGGAPVTVNPRLPEGKREVETQAIRKQYGGEGDPKAPVTVNQKERTDAPEKYQHNYGPVTYVQGAQLDAKVTAKNRHLPEAIKGQTYGSPGQALNELSTAQPGAIAFYRPEKRADNGEQYMSWDVAMKQSGQNPHLASAMMYGEDESKLGLAVKQENGGVRRVEVPREWAQQFKTAEELVDAVGKESGMKLNSKQVADPSEPYGIRL